MANFINKYASSAEYEADETKQYPNVSLVGDDIVFTAVAPPHDYSKDCLTFVAKADGTFTFSGSTTANTLSYSVDNGTTWTALADNTASPTVTTGNKILWKGSCTPQRNKGIGKFTSTAQFDVEGNAMSLLYGDNFVGQTSLEGKNYTFYYLFQNNTNVVSAENLSLPATTLANNCYQYMFAGCTSLTTAPELPATTLASNCYTDMFNSCRSLTAAPELPATTLSSYCYNGMFNGCTSLTTAPELPATTLATYCYQYMFKGCTSLTTAPELPATTLAEGCYLYMFKGCTSLTTAPELPATTLANYCYQDMFERCTRLNNITCLATDISASNCTYNWVENVASSGTFTKAASMTGWTTGTSGIPSGWTVQDYQG